MARLVIGTDKTASTAAIVVEKQPSIDSLNVTPSTSAQTIRAPSGTDGYSPVNVAAVTSSIDANIQAGNIKDGVTILGVTGNYQGGGSMPTLYRSFEISSTNTLIPDKTGSLMSFAGIKKIGAYTLTRAYSQNTTISGVVDMSSIESILEYGCFQAFTEVAGITSVNLSLVESFADNYSCSGMFSYSGVSSFDLSSLVSVVGVYSCYQMFGYCHNLTTANLNKLSFVSGGSGCASMFYNCSNLTSVDLTNLESVTGANGFLSAFSSTKLTSVDFPSLSTVNGSYTFSTAFSSCFNLTRVSFYALNQSSFGTRTNQFNNMLQSCNGVTVHFPMAIQSKIGSWSDVVNGFGGANTTVLFDIVTSLTGADSNIYARSQKNSTSTATAWTYNNTIYYTSGTTEPSVSDTIYSDSACTTAVTTISSIA